MNEFKTEIYKVLDFLPGALIEINFASRLVIYMNQIAFSIFEYSESDIEPGIPTKDIFLNDSEYERGIGILKSFGLESYESRTPYTRLEKQDLYDFMFKKKGGDPFYGECQGSFVLDGEGIPTGIRMHIRDLTKQRVMEASLQESEEKYRTLVEESTDLIFLIDNKGIVISANKAAAGSLGKEPQEIQGKNISELFPNEIAEVYQQSLNKAFTTGKSKTYENILPTGKQTRWINTSINPVKDSSGKVTAVFGVSRDITDNKLAEKALINYAQRQDQLLEIAHRLGSTLDIETVLDKVSQETQALLNCQGVTVYLLDETGRILNPVAALEPQYDEQTMATQLEIDNCLTGQTVKAKKGMIFNNAAQHPGSFQIPGTPMENEENLLVVPLMIQDEAIGAIRLFRQDKSFVGDDLVYATTIAIYVSAAVNNARIYESLKKEIAEREQMGDIVRASQMYAQNLIDSSLDMIIAVDSKRRIMEYNKAAEESFGYTKKEVLGKHTDFLYADVDQGEQIHQITLKSGRHAREVKNKRKNGEVFTSFLSTSSLTNDQGNLVGVMGVSRDISEQKASEELTRDLGHIIEDSHNEIYLFDAETLKFVLVNKGAQNNIGYTTDEIMELTPLDIKPLHDLASFEQLLKPLEAGESDNLQLETIHKRKDGSKYPVDVSLQMTSYMGKPSYLGIISDH